MLKQSDKKEKKHNLGFTILETLVAVFILTLSLTGPLAFSQSGLRSAFLARDQITAFYLAQDAIETIKNLRDQNELDDAGGDSTDWLAGIDSACDLSDATIPCNVDTTTANPTFSSCTAGEECDDLYYNETNGRFLVSGSGLPSSQFKRTIYIHEVEEDREAQIVVMVTWTSKALSGNRKVVVQENIFNWYPTDNNPD